MRVTIRHISRYPSVTSGRTINDVPDVVEGAEFEELAHEVGTAAVELMASFAKDYRPSVRHVCTVELELLDDLNRRQRHVPGTHKSIRFGVSRSDKDVREIMRDVLMDVLDAGGLIP